MKYLELAAQNALRRNAYQEAASLLVNGLELIKRLPHSLESTQQELVLRTTLGPTLMATKGFSDKEVEKVYTRALALSWQIKETPQLFPMLIGLWRFYSVRREIKTEEELANRLLRIAQDAQNPALLVEAYRGTGITLYNHGELSSAREHLEQGIALYNPQLGRSHLLLYGQDPGVVCLSYLALVLWQLGYPEQAVRKNQEALALARQLSHPFSLAYTLTWTALFHQLRWEVEATQQWAEDALSLCRERGFIHLLAMAIVTWGWALVERGRGTDGIAHIQEGIAIWEMMGAEVARKHWYALLARAYGKFGHAEKGLAILSKTMTTMDTADELFYGAELYRSKGVLILLTKTSRSRVNAEKEAETCFLKALNIARRQRAKSLELRITTDLSRLWQRQGKLEEARQMLTEIYNWFTEGFDTPDLQEAKALLAELQ